MPKQGSPERNGHVVEFDLDAELDDIDLAPVPVKLGGVTYQVRRDLTAGEVQQFWTLLRANDKDEEALYLLVGDSAVSLKSALDDLPRARMERAVQVLLQKAGLATAAGDQGEVKAS